jgi:3-oxoacyl-[acyl-carrier-protein] synthase III
MTQSNRVGASIYAIGLHFPETRLGNEELASELMGWTAEKIFDKTGINERRVVKADETALDLAEKACLDLFGTKSVTRDEVDFLILCTQAPDYILPTSACLLQDRLGLKTSVGAFDINLGCSGYVYGLSIATGLIAAGFAKKILLVTADTYSKYINKKDRSVRTLFGDGATASLVVACEPTQSSIGSFVFGTDGSGANHLIVPAGGAKYPQTQATGIETTDISGNIRSQNNLFMDGAAIMAFTLAEVPKAFAKLLATANVTLEEIDYVVFHQANAFMLEALRKKMKIPREKMPCSFEKIGNTVSSTIPVVLSDLMATQKFEPGKTVALVGFGVGLSWSACILTL